MKPVPQILVEARRSAALTQAAAAAKIGVSAACLANLEASGTSRRPAFETVARMIEAYGLDPRLLFPDDWAKASQGDDELTAFMRATLVSNESRFNILSVLYREGVEASKLLECAKNLGLVWMPVD